MLDKGQVIERMKQRGALEISAYFDTVALSGRAYCDSVIGAQGKVKLRAKFDNGIKAVLLLEEYGITWEAEEAAEEEAGEAAEVVAGITEETPAQEAAECEVKKSQHGEAVRLWREEHPAGSKKGCARDLGISLPTVRRHWETGIRSRQRRETDNGADCITKEGV